MRDTPATRPKREGARPLPVLRVPGHELPDPETGYLWAHAQVLATTESEAEQLLQPEGDPLRSISRLLAPRILYPHTAYIACIVPTFDAGRRAGLGEKEGDLTAAWSNEEDSELPVYFSWSFATGEAGDFETLAARLKAWPLPKDVGKRKLDIRGPFPGITPPTVEVESALRRPIEEGAAIRHTWPVELQERLAEAVGVATDGDETRSCCRRCTAASTSSATMRSRARRDGSTSWTSIRAGASSAASGPGLCSVSRRR